MRPQTVDLQIYTQIYFAHGLSTVDYLTARYKDYIKACLQDLNINVSNWEQLATNHTAKHSKIKIFICPCRWEAMPCWGAAETCGAQSPCVPAHICPKCGRAFLACIGLSSHLRTHSHRPSTWPGVMVILNPDGRTTPHCSLLSHDEFVAPSHGLSTLINCVFPHCSAFPWWTHLCHNNYQLWITSLWCAFPWWIYHVPWITSCHLCHGVSAVVCSWIIWCLLY